MYKQTLLAVALATNQVLTFTPPAATASDTAVRVAGQQVFQVTSAAGGISAANRASIMQKNLDNALVASQDRSPDAVSIVYVNGHPVLTMGGFYVGTVDAASARAAGTTPALLAERWAKGVRSALSNTASVNSYVAQISGTAAGNVGSDSTQAGSYTYVKQGRVVYIPAGMTIPVQLSTAVTSETARPGDILQARVSENVNLGDTSIPAGSIVHGQITDSVAGQRLGKSGVLGMKFTRLSTPDGQNIPIEARISGGIGKYATAGDAEATDTLKGETTATKVKTALLRGAVGAGGGALVGTTIGAIAGGSRGAGRGAWSGAAIGGALGVAESLLLRKGSNVRLESGTALKLMLDAPASIAVTSNTL